MEERLLKMKHLQTSLTEVVNRPTQFTKQLECPLDEALPVAPKYQPQLQAVFHMLEELIAVTDGKHTIHWAQEQETSIGALDVKLKAIPNQLHAIENSLHCS